MEFNQHRDLEGKHAYLSPSNYHWVDYDGDKFDRTYLNYLNKERGTKLHALACQCIELGIKLPDIPKTLNMYVNDCIGYRLSPEVVLYYSPNCFGTADAIGYDKNVLRIFDLKNGVTKAYMTQLEIYAALFFLEYGDRRIKLDKTTIELRIYQSNKCLVEEGNKARISQIMGSIITKDRRIKDLKGE